MERPAKSSNQDQWLYKNILKWLLRISTPSITVPFQTLPRLRRMTYMTNAKIKIATGTVVLLFALVLIPSSGGTKNQLLNQSQPEPQNALPKDAQINDNVV